MAKKPKKTRPRTVKCARVGCRHRFQEGNRGRRFCSPACKTRDWMDRHLGLDQIPGLRARIRELEAEVAELRGTRQT